MTTDYKTTLQDDVINYLSSLSDDFMINEIDDNGIYFVANGCCGSIDPSEYEHYANLYRTTLAPEALN